ncbi:SidA/IucD/PvdA family monooxygenase [Longispora fulva]|uniref:L-lysine N6-monooxygenase MbtG n=1 Tax=Longispora fulva TaxID=619741 RepID=A0A8J7KMM3_9ACTN|nr:SidA/IucD/PvdA family monooxygenase [Longispora fulva]MBG6134172.1 lysine N6-hydroxylase [Longispora fulva]
MATDIPEYHAVGIGAGPANLSVAALFDKVGPGRELALFESQSAPGWHDTMLHAGVRMQTGWLKDLVSLLDPTHHLSFLNYLVTTGRVFGLIGAGFDTIPRIEFTQYLEWAAQQLPRISYGVRIDQVSFEDGRFVSHSGGRAVARSEHLLVATGTRPQMPNWFAALPADRAIIADGLSQRLADLPADLDAPILVVGSGQTSAECVNVLLGRGHTDIRWVGRRSWFAPLEDSPSANDLYRPAYQEYFLGLPRQARRDLVGSQILTSDGISPGTLSGLYQSNYESRLRTGRFPVTILPARDVVEARMVGDEIELGCDTPGGRDAQRGVFVVLAAGRTTAPLPFDAELAREVDVSDAGEPIIEGDYSLRWKGADRNKIFLLNRGRYVQGLVDSNLSILPIRSAMIINSMAQRSVYTFRDDYVSTRWS